MDRILPLELSLAKMKWQQIPLRLNKRNREFLMRFGLDTIQSIDDVLVSERVRCPKTGKLISVSDVPNFGIRSFARLESEITRLSKQGLEKYRCRNLSKSKYANSTLTWGDIPLRLDKRNRDFLNQFQLDTLKSIDSVLVSETVLCPTTGEQISVYETPGFGVRSFRKLQSEFNKFSKLGLEQYRCERVGSNLFANSTQTWRDIPLRLGKRSRDFLERFELDSLKAIYEMLVAEKVVCPKTGKQFLISEISNFSANSLEQIRQQMAKLSNKSLAIYSYGVSEKPLSGKSLAKAFLFRLSDRDRQIFKSRCQRYTYEQSVVPFRITHERARQIIKEAVQANLDLRENARKCLAPFTILLEKKMVLPMKEALSLAQVDSAADLRLLHLIANQRLVESRQKLISRFSPAETEACRWLFSYLLKNGKLKSVRGRFPVRQLIEDAKHSKARLLDVCQATVQKNEIALDRNQVMTWLGTSWLHPFIRLQLARAGSDGMEWKKIQTVGFAKGEDLEAIANLVGENLGNGFVRGVSRLEMLSQFEVEDVLQGNSGAMSIAEIDGACHRTWSHKSVLIRKLSESKEVVLDSMGRYIHIKNLGLTNAEVERFGIWTYELLIHKQGRIDSAMLLQHLQKSNLRFRKKIQNQSHVISLASKHAGIRRCGRSSSVELSEI